MSGRDFAKVEAPTRQKPGNANRRPASSGNNNVLVGLLAILAVGFFAGYLLGKENAEGKIEDSSATAALDETIKQQEVELKILRAQVEQMSQKDKPSSDRLGDLTFYSELPQQSVTPAPLTEPDDKQVQSVIQPQTVTPATRPQPAKTTASDHHAPAPAVADARISTSGQYRVQTGSFRDAGDTALLVRKLNGIGLQASVQMGDLKGKGQWHRVYVGPFASKDDAEKVRQQIHSQLGINGLVSK